MPNVEVTGARLLTRYQRAMPHARPGTPPCYAATAYVTHSTGCPVRAQSGVIIPRQQAFNSRVAASVRLQASTAKKKIATTLCKCTKSELITFRTILTPVQFGMKHISNDFVFIAA